MIVAVLAGVAAVSAQDPATAAPAVRATDPHGFAAHIREAATRYSIPERVIHAIIRVESGFDHRAVSARGARGLMQIMPVTALYFGARDLFDPAQNITAGARYLRALLDRFGNDLPRALAAYNAGEQAVLRYGGVPPYPETRAFVARVLGLVAGGPADAPVADSPAPRESAADGAVAYHPRAVLDTLVAGVAKERVLDALATEWTRARGTLVRIEGVRIRVSRRSVRRTLVEAGEVTLREAAGGAALYWLLFENQRLLAAGRADEWPTAAPRQALDLEYTPGGPPPP